MLRREAPNIGRIDARKAKCNYSVGFVKILSNLVKPLNVSLIMADLWLLRSDAEDQVLLLLTASCVWLGSCSMCKP